MDIDNAFPPRMSTLLLLVACISPPLVSSTFGSPPVSHSNAEECLLKDSCSLSLLQRASRKKLSGNVVAGRATGVSGEDLKQIMRNDTLIEQCDSTDEDCSISLLQRYSVAKATHAEQKAKEQQSPAPQPTSQGATSQISSTENHSAPTVRRPTLLEAASYPHLHVGPTKDFCGTRPFFPQLQFDLEIYRQFGLTEGKYAQCHLPSLPNTDSNFQYHASVRYRLQRSGAIRFQNRFSWQERREHLTTGVISFFVLSTILAIAYFVGTMVSAKLAAGEHNAGDLSLLRMAVKRGALDWTGTTLAWLEPVIGRYGWANSPQIEPSELNLRLEEPTELHMAFKRAWDQEVQRKGQAKASLLQAVQLFLGGKVMTWMIFTVGAATMLEVAAMTIGLDMILSFLPLARSVSHWAKFVNSMDTATLAIIFIVLGFVIPMIARAFYTMASLKDAHYTHQVTSAMLALVYKKSQRLASGAGTGLKDAQTVQMLTNDIRSMWNGSLLKFAHSVISPACAAFFMMYLVYQIGNAASCGVVCTFSLGLLYLPIRRHWNQDDLHSRQSALSRLGLMKETILNVHTVKTANWDRPLSQRVQGCHDAELKMRSNALLVQTFLEIPVSIFPYVLIMSTLVLTYFFNGRVTHQEIFACMQVLAGLVRFAPILSDSMKHSVEISRTANHVQQYLNKAEQPAKEDQVQVIVASSDTRNAHPSGTAVDMNQVQVKVKGSFKAVGAKSTMLHNVDFEARPGELIAVVGEVASGKSALLSAIRGDLISSDKSSLVQAPEDIAFCSQAHSVIDGTLEDNIANGEVYDLKRFYDALDTTFELTGWPEINETVKVHEDMTTISKEDQVQDDEEEVTPFPYLELWRAATMLVLIVSVANINWNKTSVVLGILVASVQGLLHWAVLEFPMKTLATLAAPRQHPKEGNAENTTVVLNYNLLAMSQADVDECMQNMLEAYVNNLSENVSAVLISASNDRHLQEYEEQVRNEHRAWLYKQLYRSGLCWAGFARGEHPNQAWKKQVWTKYEHLDKAEFVRTHLHAICERYAKEYMVLHRTTRVLRKCGQYQDLILLSDGEDKVFTYCDVGRYGAAARQEGEPLFKPSADAANMFNRKFEYTLVLDSDTRVEIGAVEKLLSVAVAHPDKAIVQPSIKMYCGPRDPIFMHLEVMRQRIYEPMYDSVANAIGKSSFFGKGLIKNSLYKDACLGSRGHLVESVPIDVLSHDTFEAAVAEVMYCNSVHLLEAPPQTYITWDIRERRWNLGEFILAGYFWPNFVGRPMHWFQSWVQGKKLFRKQCRCRPQMDGAKAYLAHSAMRQMVMKPCLLLYVILMHFAELHWRLLPFFTVLFMVLVVPKFAVMTRNNCREVLLETFASLMQFTPEAVVGTIRVMSALLAHFVGKVSWTPQRSVEEESKASNPFLFSMRYLWYYSVLAFFWTLRVISLWWPNVGNEAIFIFSILGTLFILPVYAGFTSLRADTFGRFFTEQNCTEERASGFQHMLSSGGSVGASQKNAEVSEIVVDADLVAKVNALTQMELEKQLGKLSWKPATAKACGVRNSCLSQVDRAGVSIARAAYSTSKLVLLDDPFAAVDATIGKHFLDKVICGPLMQNRTRIVSMLPNSTYLQRFDKVVVVSKGHIVAQGSPQEVMAGQEFQELMPPRDKQSAALPSANNASSQWNMEAYLRQPNELRAAPRPVESTKPQTTPLESIGAFLEGESLNFETTFDFMDETQRPLQLSTMRDLVQDGGFGWLTLAAMCLLLFRLCMQGVMILLGRWADQAADENQTSVINLICIMNVVFVAYLCHIAQGYALSVFNTNASRKFFQRAFVSVLQAPIDGFWSLKSASRINGLLSSAMLNVEHALASGSFAMAGVAADIAIQQVFCLFILPMWVKIPTYVMVCILCGFCGNATWHLQLLSNMALTKWQEEQVNLKSRHHSPEQQKQLADQLCRYASLFALPDSLCSYVRTWTVSRISFCICFQCTLCILVAIWRPDRITIDALIMVITSTFYILMQLEPLVASMGKAVSAGISVQQLADYSTVPQDAPELMQGDESRRLNFLMDGIAVRFEGVSASYGAHGRDVLSNVGFSIARKSKAVLAGPPGSGKSTALNCITRMLGLKQGKVYINDTDIKQIGMAALRRLVLLVPQEPVVFQGTVRFNIDPLNQFPDEQVWKAAKAAQLSLVRDNELKHIIEDEGSNVSRGQKVLINYARAVCQQPALLLLDDCLPALDMRKQEAIRNDIMVSFNNSTIIAAACNVENFAVFDHLVVLEKGCVMREGPMRGFL